MDVFLEKKIEGTFEVRLVIKGVQITWVPGTCPSPYSFIWSNVLAKVSISICNESWNKLWKIMLK
jgi:hypothetical protein